jgi:electron transfer flavoprotein alpha subunit
MSESKIWVIAEVRENRLAEVSLELLAKAKELAPAAGCQVAAVLAGSGITELGNQLAGHGADEVLLADHPLLADYCNTAYVKVLEQAVLTARPEIILLGATAQGADLGPRLAARLRTGLSAHCIDLELTEAGELLAVVPGWGGSVMAKISCPVSRPQMATVMPGMFAMPEKSQVAGKVSQLPVDLTDADISYRVVEIIKKEAVASDLDGADVVVAGGWGVGSADDWQLVEELAASLKGAVGCTRPPVDEGWAKESQMIGTSGRSVSPKLYISLAGSGNMHHLVGVKKPGLAVGVNSDPKAAIFEHCDIGLVGDFKEITSALMQKIKQF